MFNDYLTHLILRTIMSNVESHKANRTNDATKWIHSIGQQA
ncbi:hypothetical protein NC653_022770 [Populus alba x Populus x berolinensis]|uniref:Uncharacterized protein n=1 Tax=Populus alba x Populus x berolinensis TaxID=444605 RepID=A0AAD6MHX3_9ROSI|nr:hypothetical protein NC653_022770 [Populus alba x Populus x berolinensis]